MNEIDHPSPNFAIRSAGRIDRIVLHDTEGSLQGTLSWFANKQSGVSTHIVIGKDGTIYRCVDDRHKAWHVRNHNDTTLGVELEMLKDDPDGSFPSAQLAAAAEWCAEKCVEYRIPMNQIRSHAELDPGRRTDPRGLNWYNFLLDVAFHVYRNIDA